MKKRIKKLLFGSALTVLLGSMSACILQNVDFKKNTFSISAETQTPPEDDYLPQVSDWFTIDAEAYAPKYESDGVTLIYEGKSDLSILFSPVFSDYQNVNSDSLNDFLFKKDDELNPTGHDQGLIGALKYILATQVNFIQPVEMPESPREYWGDDLSKEQKQATAEAAAAYSERDAIFDEFVNGALSDPEIVDAELFAAEYDKFRLAMEEGTDEDTSSITSNANFLRAVLAYMAAKGVGTGSETTDIAAIAARLGVDESGNLIPVAAGNESGLYKALQTIYNRKEAGQDNLAEDIKTIFEDACEIVTGDLNESLVLAECFVLLQDTQIPVETLVTILGEDIVKQTVIDIFQDETIDPEIAQHFLETITTDTCYDLCQSVYFTKQDIKEAIEAIDPARLMDIARGLSQQALDNIRIILGCANDNDQNPKMIKRAQEHFKYDDQYNEFGNDLVNIVLGNMGLMDMVDGIEAIWIDNPSRGEDKNYLLYTSDYTANPGTAAETTEKGRRLYTRNLIDFINNELPTLEDISNRNKEDQKETFHVEIKAAINQDPIYIDLTVGFQEKECKDLVNFVKLLDDTFDLTFDFIEGPSNDYSLNQFKYELVAKPQYLTNLIEFICNSDIVKNTEELRLKERLFSLGNKTIGELKNYFNDDIAEQMIKDLGNLDYETAIDTLLTISKFKEVFKNTTLTQTDINYFVTNLAWIAEKGKTITFDRLKEVLTDVLGETLANKIKDTDFENLMADLNALCNEIDLQDISVDMLKEITNTEIYDFVNLLGTKQETVNRVANLIYRILNTIPSEFDSKRFMDYYSSSYEMFEFNNTYAMNWDDLLLLLPLGNKIYRVISDMVHEEDKMNIGNGHITVQPNEGLDEDSKGLYEITYCYKDANGADCTLNGLLPEGATLVDFAPNKIGEKEINYWVIKEDSTSYSVGDKVLNMVDEEIVVEPIFKFASVVTTTADEIEYNGDDTITLTASASIDDYNYSYQWQKKDSSGNFVNINGATTSSIVLSETEQTGTYRCVITSDKGDVVYSNEITIRIFVVTNNLYGGAVPTILLGITNIILLIIWFFASYDEDEDPLTIFELIKHIGEANEDEPKVDWSKLSETEKIKYRLERKKAEFARKKAAQKAKEQARILRKKEQMAIEVEYEKEQARLAILRADKKAKANLAREQAKLDRLEARRRAAEKARIERERLAKKRALEKERARIAREKAREKARIERERAAERARLERERLAKKRALEKERARIAREKARERARIEREKARIAREKAREKARLERERAAERARIEREKAAERARLERERLAKIRAEERAAAERAREQARIEKELHDRMLKEQLEKNRAEKLAKDKLTKEREKLLRKQALENARQEYLSSKELKKAKDKLARENLELAITQSKNDSVDTSFVDLELLKKQFSKNVDTLLVKDKNAKVSSINIVVTLKSPKPAKQISEVKGVVARFLDTDVDDVSINTSSAEVLNKEKLRLEREQLIQKQTAERLAKKEAARKAKEDLANEKAKLAREKALEKEKLAQQKAAEKAKEKANKEAEKEADSKRKESMTQERAAELAREKLARRRAEMDAANLSAKERGILAAHRAEIRTQEELGVDEIVEKKAQEKYSMEKAIEILAKKKSKQRAKAKRAKKKARLARQLEAANKAKN